MQASLVTCTMADTENEDLAPCALINALKWVLREEEEL